MKAICTAELLEGIPNVGCFGPLDQAVQRICCDSRRAGVGSLFVALKGKRRDGHAFLYDAYARGAAVSVGEIPFSPPAGKAYVRVADSHRALSQISAALYGHPTARLFTVGVTGTKGKTSVTHCCAALFEDVACLSTVANPALDLPNTTPMSCEIQRLAFEALSQGKRHFVLEISAHGLAQHRVADVQLDVAVFTNLSQDHFDDFQGFEDYFQAKAQLFTTLKPRAAVINADDPYGRRLMEQTTAPVISYGLAPSATVRAEGLELERTRSRFTVRTPQGCVRLCSPLPGLFNVYNALAAVGVGLWAGLPLEIIRLRLENLTGLPGRLERLCTPRGVYAVVDFAHSPDSLEQALRFLKDHYPRVLAVFGCGGESDPYKRPLMGQISGKWADYTILTHDNPKHEDPLKILAQIESGVRASTTRYHVTADRREAINQALQLAMPGDCVLVAGKGHETTQIFGDRAVPFNDADYLKAHCGAIACQQARVSPPAPWGVSAAASTVCPPAG